MPYFETSAKEAWNVEQAFEGKRATILASRQFVMIVNPLFQ
jgi:hypothetical protein